MNKLNAIVYINGVKYYMAINSYKLSENLSEYKAALPFINLEGTLLEDTYPLNNCIIVSETKDLEKMEVAHKNE